LILEVILSERFLKNKSILSACLMLKINASIPININKIVIGIPQPSNGISSPDINNNVAPVEVILVIIVIIINDKYEMGNKPAIEHNKSSGKYGINNIKNNSTFSLPFIAGMWYTDSGFPLRSGGIAHGCKSSAPALRRRCTR
jgi:hypothetical protein